MTITKTKHVQLFGKDNQTVTFQRQFPATYAFNMCVEYDKTK